MKQTVQYVGCGWHTVSAASELNDVVCLLTRDEDVRDGKWSVVANAKPVKSSGDVVSFQLDRLVRGRSVDAVYKLYSPTVSD